MNEHDVWSRTTEYIKKLGGRIIAACPPGGSSIYPRFALYDASCRKRDEPDILAIIQNDLYIIECKPSCDLCFKNGLKASSPESDYDKLMRIESNCKAGKYTQQLLQNYLIDINTYSVHKAISYYANSTIISGPILNLTHFIVTSTGATHIVH